MTGHNLNPFLTDDEVRAIEADVTGGRLRS
jgi:hypothetical protein